LPLRVCHFLSVAVLILHLLWILWVIFGALFTRKRAALRYVHIASLVYGVFIEITPWPPCPLTVLEQWLEEQAGIVPYNEPFVVHYLEAVIYPDIPLLLLVSCAVAVCLFNLGIYAVRCRRRMLSGR
jgi:hypothetical protein